MKFTCLFFLLMGLFTPICSQSIYHDSSKNSFFSTTAVTKSDNYLSIGSGVGYSFNSTVDIAFIYSWQRDIEEMENKFKKHGSGLGVYIDFLLLNEVKGDALGAEIGFVYNKSSFASTDGWRGETLNKIFGVGLNLSKRVMTGETGIIVPQLAFTFFPISETTMVNPAQSYYEKYSALSFTFGVVRNISSLALVAEPSIILNLYDQSVSPAISLSLIF